MSTMMVAVMGDAASVAAFGAIGFEVVPAQNADEAREAWDSRSWHDYAVVLVTPPVYEAIADLLSGIAESPTPAVTVIPQVGVGSRAGQEKIDRAIERALGVAVPIREEES